MKKRSLSIIPLLISQSHFQWGIYALLIGNSLKHIAEKCGYEVVGINYIGDWGTQFGKLITAYKNGEMKQ